MANLSITAANVIAASTASQASAIAGETITAGQPVYVSSGTAYKADRNASQTAARVNGIALHGSLAGQPLAYCTAGALTLGSVMVAGTTYALSDTAGSICPYADITNGASSGTDYVSILGVASSSSVLQVSITNTETVYN